MRRLSALILLLPFFLADPAWGLAGGATGSGGGGGGFSGGSSGGSSSFGSSSHGSSGGGGGSLPAWGWVLIVVVVGVPFLLPVLIRSWRNALSGLARRKLRRRASKVSDAAAAAHADDGYWDAAALRERVRQAFRPIQNSWEKRDVSASRPYVSDALYDRHRLQLEGLERQHRVNRIANLRLHDAQIVRIHNVTDDNEDRFVAYVRCSARDWVEDTRTGRLVNGNPSSPTEFEQYWSFVRHPEYGWVLDEIQQREEGDYHLSAEIVNADEGPRTWEQTPAGSP